MFWYWFAWAEFKVNPSWNTVCCYLCSLWLFHHQYTALWNMNQSELLCAKDIIRYPFYQHCSLNRPTRRRYRSIQVLLLLLFLNQGLLFMGILITPRSLHQQMLVTQFDTFPHQFLLTVKVTMKIDSHSSHMLMGQ